MQEWQPLYDVIVSSGVTNKYSNGNQSSTSKRKIMVYEELMLHIQALPSIPKAYFEHFYPLDTNFTVEVKVMLGIYGNGTAVYEDHKAGDASNEVYGNNLKNLQSLLEGRSKDLEKTQNKIATTRMFIKSAIRGMTKHIASHPSRYTQMLPCNMQNYVIKVNRISKDYDYTKEVEDDIEKLHHFGKQLEESDYLNVAIKDICKHMKLLLQLVDEYRVYSISVFELRSLLPENNQRSKLLKIPQSNDVWETIHHCKLNIVGEIFSFLDWFQVSKPKILGVPDLGITPDDCDTFFQNYFVKKSLVCNSSRSWIVLDPQRTDKWSFEYRIKGNEPMAYLAKQDGRKLAQ